MNITSDWVMVVITVIYVIATIAICVFNYKSAKATREQVAESKRQFDETNRPYVTCDYIYERRLIHGLRIMNHGKRVAQEVKLQVNDSFVKVIKNVVERDVFEKIEQFEYTIGIDQYYDFYFGNINDLKHEDIPPLQILIRYKDGDRGFEEVFKFPFNKYAPVFSTYTFENDVLNKIKATTGEIKNIGNGIAQMNRDICKALNISEDNASEKEKTNV